MPQQQGSPAATEAAPTPLPAADWPRLVQHTPAHSHRPHSRWPHSRWLAGGGRHLGTPPGQPCHSLAPAAARRSTAAAAVRPGQHHCTLPAAAHCSPDVAHGTVSLAHTGKRSCAWAAAEYMATAVGVGPWTPLKHGSCCPPTLVPWPAQGRHSLRWVQLLGMIGRGHTLRQTSVLGLCCGFPGLRCRRANPTDLARHTALAVPLRSKMWRQLLQPAV